MEIIEKVKELICNLLKEKELEIVEATYKRQGPNMVLRLTLDKIGGVTLDECAWVNERLGELLDKEDIIPQQYLLEVSSPGLDRKLKSKKDFERIKGELIRVITYGPVDEKREHIGKVLSCGEKELTLELTDTNLARIIPLDKITNARLEIKF